MYLLGSKDIKFYIKKWIADRNDFFKNKTVLDLPAGNGLSSKQLHDIGAKVIAADLFPEFFRVPELKCTYTDLAETLPYADQSMDFVLCQEGIEHVTDQYRVLKEFARILKTNGTLVITTPNYSNLRSRMSYLLNESELMGKIMPPNEVDSVWFNPSQKNKIYFGHVNLIGIQRLRLFAKLAGLNLVQVHANRVNYTSLMLFPILYPLISYFSWASYRRMKRKQGKEAAEKVKESFKLALSPSVLLQNHLIVEFKKVYQAETSTKESLSRAEHFVT
ncbi:class I SAM-dependent methyltransferase [Bdellovibrio reynosensis]|uniref:Class I SAM-dependent methyltransferase n=1 Tax=Bdellovibrio reynosensis TaxID=2835041 RepID=A0ABY4CB77_9BACT|nr:class I SAM-dependent methyltransferase [Bdellovibrio reynosensis]UOF02228.1 class I SAM-dependent methyltransferase [Bdellovibrio reynosensis]